MTGACVVLDTKGDNREGGTGVLAKGTSSALWATVYRGMRCCTTKRTCRQRPCGIIAMTLSLRPSIKDITVCWKLGHRPKLGHDTVPGNAFYSAIVAGTLMNALCSAHFLDLTCLWSALGFELFLFAVIGWHWWEPIQLLQGSVSTGLGGCCARASMSLVSEWLCWVLHSQWPKFSWE